MVEAYRGGPCGQPMEARPTMCDLSRRQFLAVTSAAAAAGATVFDLPRVFAEGRAQTDSPFGGLPIVTILYSLFLLKKLKNAKSL